MNSANQTVPPLPEAAAVGVDHVATLGDIAIDTNDYVRAWSALFASEAHLAGISMIRLVFGLLLVPAIGLAICINVDALMAALLQRWLHDWSSATALVLCFNLLCLFALVAAMRRWWRNLSLPRSRTALGNLLKRFT